VSAGNLEPELIYCEALIIKIMSILLLVSLASVLLLLLSSVSTVSAQQVQACVWKLCYFGFLSFV
jgi:hypothetical protein